MALFFKLRRAVLLYVAERGAATVSMMFTLWVCLFVFTGEAAAATASSCLPASSQVHTTTGVVIRFMTAEQRAAASAQVSRDTGRIIDPRYASNMNVAARIPGRLPLLRVVVPTGMSVTLGERITIARSHTVAGDPCTQIPNLVIPTPISGLALPYERQVWSIPAIPARPLDGAFVTHCGHLRRTRPASVSGHFPAMLRPLFQASRSWGNESDKTRADFRNGGELN